MPERLGTTVVGRKQQIRRSDELALYYPVGAYQMLSTGEVRGGGIGGVPTSRTPGAEVVDARLLTPKTLGKGHNGSRILTLSTHSCVAENKR